MSDIYGVKASIVHLFISPGHDFRGRHKQGRLEHGISDCDEIECVAGSGIRGDRYFDFKEDFKGQITFFSHDVFEEVKKRFGLPSLEASAFRRNVVIAGVDLNEFIGKRFRIGDVEFEGAEEAAPCYWMDEACAPGVEEFLRGNGGLRCRIRESGLLRKGAAELQSC